MNNPTWFWFNSISVLLAGFRLSVKSLLDDIKDTAHADGTEEVLEGEEGVGDAEEQWGELEIDKEDHDAKVDEGVRGGDQVRLLINNKHERGQKTRLGGAEIKDAIGTFSTNIFLSYKLGTRNSTLVGVQTPRHSRSATLTKPAPLPLMAPMAIMMM